MAGRLGSYRSAKLKAESGPQITQITQIKGFGDKLMRLKAEC
jgi:hypothetical protein